MQDQGQADTRGGDLRFVLALFLGSRLLIAATAVATQLLSPRPRPLPEVLRTWDAGWYLSIIQHGYQLVPDAHLEGDAANWAFFPLSPLLARLAAQVSGLPAMAAAYLLPNLCFGLYLWLLSRYCARLFDAPTRRFVVAAAAFAPLSVYTAVPYTEALYGLLLLAAIHLAAEDRWLWAGLCAAGLSATRNLGVMVVFPLLLLAVRQHGWRALRTLRPGTERALTALALAPLGLFLYMLFLHLLTGDALAFVHIQVAWGRVPGNPLMVLAKALVQGRLGNRIAGLVALLSLGAAAWLWLRNLRPEALVLAIGVLIPLSTATVSMPRYALTLYPCFVALGLFTAARPRLRAPLLALFVLVDAFCVASWVAGAGYMI